ncbi:CENP-B N-terminal DNA-binding domain [Popillia japonica]|uniref:CENP-B N-terminal DNA-binding domain n=1 Tax=Popillia japonica TaxID=7064 RepID=A0AAW1JFZ6_POPJA
MPTAYKRKGGSTRGQLRQVDLGSNFNAVQNGTEIKGQLRQVDLGSNFNAVQNGTEINAAAKAFSIPSSTLERRLKNKKMEKGNFGRSYVPKHSQFLVQP